jgi:hypothetical protein
MLNEMKSAPTSPAGRSGGENQNPVQPPPSVEPASAPVTPPGAPAINKVIPPVPAGNMPTHPVKPEGKHFWKSKWFLLLVLFLSILIPVSVFAAAKITSKPTPVSSPEPSAETASPSPIDETASWKTYTGIGYTIKYPADWIVNPTQSSAYVSIGSPYLAKDRQDFYLNIATEQSDKTTNDWLKDKTIGGFCCGDFTLSPGMSIDGVSFQEVKNPNSEYHNVIAKVKGKFYYLNVSSGALDGGIYYYDKSDKVLMNNVTVADQIISTFKFTSSSDETAKAVSDVSEELGSGYTNVKIQGIYNDYSLGSAGFSTSGGGILFYAHKENGTWVVFWRGNEVPGCSKFTNYPDLPQKLACDPNY